jgi:hypothetical protein
MDGWRLALRGVPDRFSATVQNGAADVEVPILVLCGDWLKAIGFPIGSAAYLTTGAQGDLALNRMGLRMPKRVYIRKASP